MTSFADFSGPVTVFPLASICGTPALRKYLLTMMSVASWLHCLGISASFISNTTLPSGLLMRLVRFSYVTLLNTSVPGFVNRRWIFISVLPFELWSLMLLYRSGRRTRAVARGPVVLGSCYMP